jgi:pimeloyl-ACP methyl ester carboxylesterase
MGNTRHDSETRHTARISRRGVLAAGALGVTASLAAAMRASAFPFPTINQSHPEATMTPLTTTPSQTPPAPATATDPAIRPFSVNVPDAALADLRQRLAATRWPDKETVPDRSQGNQLATIQDIVHYWGTDYDWRKAEAKLNALPQFLTTIDGVDIHFLQVRSPHPNALPLIMTHGWPGSVFEFLETVAPLTDPPSTGGRAEDAFDLVIPSLPGFGFSGKPTTTGWDPDHIAHAWAQLMQRLGYPRYVAQGGDWGSPITSAMARQAPAGLLGIHITLPATLPPEIVKSLAPGAPEPAGLSAQERAALDALDTYRTDNSAYFAMLTTRPQLMGYALTDSPVGLAAFLYDYNGGEPEQSLTKDQMLDDITLYWLTNSAASSARLYFENKGVNFVVASLQKTGEIALPVAITAFPGELYQAPESWARRAYRTLIYFHAVDKGGHFAAWEQPDLFATELQAAFRSLR